MIFANFILIFLSNEDCLIPAALTKTNLVKKLGFSEAILIAILPPKEWPIKLIFFNPSFSIN